MRQQRESFARTRRSTIISRNARTRDEIRSCNPLSLLCCGLVLTHNNTRRWDKTSVVGNGNALSVTLYNNGRPSPPLLLFLLPLLLVPHAPPVHRAKLQNKLLYSANIGGVARRAKPQSPHMYQAVRDPLSNLHFNACHSSIITSGTAWLNFTDASPSPPLPYPRQAAHSVDVSLFLSLWTMRLSLSFVARTNRYLRRVCSGILLRDKFALFLSIDSTNKRYFWTVLYLFIYVRIRGLKDFDVWYTKSLIK